MGEVIREEDGATAALDDTPAEEDAAALPDPSTLLETAPAAEEDTARDDEEGTAEDEVA